MAIVVGGLVGFYSFMTAAFIMESFARFLFVSQATQNKHKSNKQAKVPLKSYC